MRAQRDSPPIPVGEYGSREGAGGACHGAGGPTGRKWVPKRGAVPVPHLTLMRPPVVKRQKYPVSGFLLFFRLLDSSIVGNRQRVLT